MPPYDKDSRGNQIDNSDPPSKFVAITPSDTTDLTLLNIRGLWIGVAGNLAVIGLNDSGAITFKNVPAGLFVGMVKKVMATNTTATEIVGLI